MKKDSNIDMAIGLAILGAAIVYGAKQGSMLVLAAWGLLALLGIFLPFLGIPLLVLALAYVGLKYGRDAIATFDNWLNDLKGAKKN
jgi:hypothetical protein